MERVQATAIVRDILEQEAIFLEEKRWDDWLSLYTPDCLYWVPAWRRDGTLCSDPRRELSLIYYASRGGLEDRVIRIRSGQSPAGEQLARTTHLVSNVRLEDAEQSGGMLKARASFATHFYAPKDRKPSICFGNLRVKIVQADAQWRIKEKIVQLQNDYIETFLDVYCL
ncbi:aromatic-ring-hydroxylating dioxygenase subunit beta [Sphingobium estronivorans]|uniref:aromatic-ring-hydroxylating dioxygenase subunit beta n=1 Tax=Sphingobium estronivorans TaxID=1577690 RepID=UPI0013C2C4D3|nr:aromatic-ring-hydroxylating dioxygenase subunit beta [Sphingobium estronivorans]